MSLLSIPKELEGVKLAFKEKDPITGDGEWVLPDDATSEQIKAFKKYGERIRQMQREQEG
jgi:hypothetical protein